MTRYGFGEKTGETDGGLSQYENGHIDVSGQALKHVIEQYPEQPPKHALGRMLLGETDADGESGD